MILVTNRPKLWSMLYYLGHWSYCVCVNAACTWGGINSWMRGKNSDNWAGRYSSVCTICLFHFATDFSVRSSHIFIALGLHVLESMIVRCRSSVFNGRLWSTETVYCESAQLGSV